MIDNMTGGYMWGRKIFRPLMTPFFTVGRKIFRPHTYRN